MVIKVQYDVNNIYVSSSESPVYISVSYVPGGITTVEWGDIEGTLSDQTDLQNALDDKVPYTGASGDVDLGEYELKAGQVEFDQSPTGTAGVGVMRWNNTDGTLDLGLKGGSVTLQVGEDIVARVVNKTGVNLLASNYQVVKVSSAQGQRLAVNFAQANNDNNSADTIGLVSENISNNQEGWIQILGQLTEINTTGSLQGETWSDGDVLYLSPTTAGSLTNVKPVAPQHIVVLGYVEYAHSQHGKIYVKVMNGWELGELHDVDTTGATNGQVLTYNSALGIWKPATNGSGTVTSITASSPLTGGTITSSGSIGITQASGSANGYLSSTDWTTFNNKQNALTNPITGSAASGQVAYFTGATSQAGSANFTWDGNNVNLGNDKGIVLQTSGTNRNTKLYPTVVTDNFSAVAFYPSSGTNVGQAFQIIPRGTGFTSAIKSQFSILNTDLVADSTNFEGMVVRAAGTAFTIATGKGGTGTIRPLLLSAGFTDTVTNPNQLWIYPSGNIGINTSSDGGQRLQVQGDAFIKGSGNTSGSTALTVQNSDSSNILRIRNNAEFFLGSTFNVGLSPMDKTSTNHSISGSGLSFFDGSQTTGTAYRFSGNNITDSGGSPSFQVRIGRNYAPTSGTGTFVCLSVENAINQTGGANGITRGLYVNPTLTAAADWRSIEWSNNTGWGLYGAGTANNYLAGDVYIGTTTTSATKFTVSGSETASSAIARGTLINTTLTAAANNDVLVGLDVNPTFTNTLNYTGLLPIGIRSRTSTTSNITSTTAIFTNLGDSGNNGVQEALRLESFRTVGSPANGFGIAQTFYSVIAQAANSTGEVGRFEITANMGTPASVSSRRFDFKIKGNVNTDALYNAFSFVTTSSAGVGVFQIPTSSLLINTTTSAGFTLDVNGTARVQGALTVTGDIGYTVNLSYIKIYATSDPGYARRLEIDQPNCRIKYTNGNSDGAYFLTRLSNVSTTVYDSTYGAGSGGGHNGRHLFQCNSVDTFSISGANGLVISDAINITTSTTTGTKIGTATSQKIGFWNATPIVQPTTAVAESTFVENSGGTAINVDSTFDGYTLQQVVKALRNAGLLA